MARVLKTISPTVLSLIFFLALYFYRERIAVKEFMEWIGGVGVLIAALTPPVLLLSGYIWVHNKGKPKVRLSEWHDAKQVTFCVTNEGKESRLLAGRVHEILVTHRGIREAVAVGYWLEWQGEKDRWLQVHGKSPSYLRFAYLDGVVLEDGEEKVVVRLYGANPSQVSLPFGSTIRCEMEVFDQSTSVKSCKKIYDLKFKRVALPEGQRQKDPEWEEPIEEKE